MKKTIFQILALALIASLSVGYTGCKKKKEDEPAQEQQKTLNKSTLTPNKWKSSNPPILHDFRANGKYGVDGEWRWIGNSDTMEIKYTVSSGSFVKWKIYWNTDSEMFCRWIANDQDILFQHQP